MVHRKGEFVDFFDLRQIEQNNVVHVLFNDPMALQLELPANVATHEGAENKTGRRVVFKPIRGLHIQKLHRIEQFYMIYEPLLRYGLLQHQVELVHFDSSRQTAQKVEHLDGFGVVFLDHCYGGLKRDTHRNDIVFHKRGYAAQITECVLLNQLLFILDVHVEIFQRILLQIFSVQAG